VKVKRPAVQTSWSVDDGTSTFLRHQTAFCATILASDELTRLGESLVRPAIDLGLGTVFCFAVNGENIFYCVGTTEERAKDMPVYMITHVASSWATDNIAKSLQEFLSWRRVPRKWLRMT
jgi:hypothetical protein